MKTRERQLQEEVSRLEGLLATMKKRIKTVQEADATKDSEIQKLTQELNRLQQLMPEKKHEALLQCEAELRLTVEKVARAVSAIEVLPPFFVFHLHLFTQSDMTCLNCMGVFDHPMTLIPCGHVMCKKCCERQRDSDGNVICVVWTSSLTFLVSLT